MVTALIVSSVLTARAQQADSLGGRLSGLEHHDDMTLLVGYHQGRQGFAELGIGRSVWGSNRHPYGMSYYFGVEARVDRPEVWGAKAGAYVAGGFAMGVQYIHYMDGVRSMEVLRPEIGIGLFKFKLTYAYNWRLTRPRIEGVSTHMASVSYAFRLSRRGQRTRS